VTENKLVYGLLLCLKTETELASETSCFFKKYTMDKVPQKEDCVR